MIWQRKWKQIPEFPNYWVSNDGRIFNMKYLRLIQIYPGEYGLPVAYLSRNNKVYHRSIPKLIKALFN